MLNIEYWKDELKKIEENGNVVAVKNNIPESCTANCLNCDFHSKSETTCSKTRCKSEKIYDWLCEEFEEPDWDTDIDWMKVPADTEVIVRDKESQEWRTAFFTMFFPKANNKYAVFGFGDKHSDAVNAEMWKFCKLKNPEDIKKYRRENDAEH